MVFLFLILEPKVYTRGVWTQPPGKRFGTIVTTGKGSAENIVLQEESNI